MRQFERNVVQQSARLALSSAQRTRSERTSQCALQVGQDVFAMCMRCDAMRCDAMLHMNAFGAEATCDFSPSDHLRGLRA